MSSFPAATLAIADRRLGGGRIASLPLLCLSGGLLLAPGLAHAVPATFAQYTEQSTATTNVRFVNNGTSANLNTINTALGDRVFFSFTSFLNLPAGLTGPQNAILTVNNLAGVSTTAAATLVGRQLSQPINNQIVLKFTRATPFVDHRTSYGSNLLTITLSSLLMDAPSIDGLNNGRSPTIQFDNTTFTLSYSSDFVTFAPGSEEDGSISFSAGQPPLSRNANGFLNTFTADTSGTFASDPPARAFILPEPGSLALIGTALFGFGFVRRRRS